MSDTPTCIVHRIPLTAKRSDPSTVTWWECAMCQGASGPSWLVPARLPASEPPSDLPRRLRAEANWLAEGYARDMTVTVAVLEEARDAIVESASTLAALRAEVDSERAKTRSMWEEREGWKRTASERGFELIGLRAEVDRLRNALPTEAEVRALEGHVSGFNIGSWHHLGKAAAQRQHDLAWSAIRKLDAALAAPPAEGPGR